MSEAKIEIHPYCLADSDELFEAAVESIAEVSPWLQWCHVDYSIDEAREWVRNCVERFGAGGEYGFNIRDAEGNFLGGCGLNHIQPMHRMANLGYWVRTSQAGRGIATAAVARLAAFAFEETDLARLEIVCAVDNESSQRVAEKAGALREGILLDRLWGLDGPQDAVMYSLLRSGRHIRGSGE